MSALCVIPASFSGVSSETRLGGLTDVDARKTSVAVPSATGSEDPVTDWEP